MGWKYEILENPHGNYRFPKYLHGSDEIRTKIPATIGVDVVFRVDGKGKYKTITNSPRRVYGSISSWVGISPGAVHYYAKLRYHPVNVKVIEPRDKYERKGDIHGTNVIPDICKGLELTVRTPAKKDMKSWSISDGDYIVRAKKGDMTNLYDTKEDALEALHQEFVRIFGEGWYLKVGK